MLSSLPRVLPLSLAVVLVLGGCAKHEPSAEAAPAAVEPADAAPVADAAASADEPSAEQRAAAEKKAKIERALANQAIIDDPQGQWATQATASSTYASVITSAHNGEWTPEAATGAPDAANNGDDHAGWSPAKQDAGIEWLQLDYAQPVNAHALRVRQLGTPGAIIKVELIDDAGARHTVWDGSDDTAYDRDEISWFERRFEPTSYKAKGVRLTLATNAIDGRTYLDAVQLVGK